MACPAKGTLHPPRIPRRNRYSDRCTGTPTVRTLSWAPIIPNKSMGSGRESAERLCQDLQSRREGMGQCWEEIDGWGWRRRRSKVPSESVIRDTDPILSPEHASRWRLTMYRNLSSRVGQRRLCSPSLDFTYTNTSKPSSILLSSVVQSTRSLFGQRCLLRRPSLL